MEIFLALGIAAALVVAVLGLSHFLHRDKPAAEGEGSARPSDPDAVTSEP